MAKLRFAAVTAAVAALGLMGTGAAAWAAAGGDPNAGDVWLDNVGQPAGPGHEMDPHLACQDINLWGDKLADSSGTYTIDGWPPSGSQEVDYSSSWSYSQSQGGDQVTSVINVQQLISQAQANGDTPAAQGYHFKLDFSQDPQKHKTFWVNCPAPSTSTPSSGTTAPSGTSSGTPSSGTTAPSGTSSGTPTSGTTAPSSTSSSSSPRSIAGTHLRHKRHRKHRRHRKHKHSVAARHISRAPRLSSGFTG